MQVHLEIQQVTAKVSLQFPRQHGDLSILNKQCRMLYARTQAGDNGHPRALAHVSFFALPMIDNIHNMPKLPWKSNGPPLRVHLDFQANIAIVRL